MEVIVKKKSKDKNYFNEISEGKLRVVAYARVSTEMERQLGSFESQKQYYYEKITSNPEWEFKGIYADEGISATACDDRNGFVNMIRDARNKKFDMILTKSVSRFARNTVDTLKFIRILKSKNIAVFFEEESINTLDYQGELLLTILGSLAQQESENTAAHLLKGKEMALKTGNRKIWNGCYGYDYDKKTRKLIKNDAAKNVKLIFELYNKYENLNTIINELHERGIKSPSGQDFWTPNAITMIIVNEKYIGNVVFGTHYVYETIGHKIKRNNGEREKYRYYNYHEGIIDEDLFKEVNEKYKANRVKVYWRYSNKVGRSILSWKGVCGFCGYSIALKSSHTLSNPYYRCRTSAKPVMRYLCPNSKIIRQTEIESSYLKGMKKLRNKINLNTLDESLNGKISYVRSLILNADFKKFNYDLFDQIINLVIIGGYDENGEPDPYMIRFIIKEDEIFDNKFKNRNNFSGSTIDILEFDNVVNRNYNSFDKNRVFSKIKIDSIKVKIEIENDDSLVWKL